MPPRTRVVHVNALGQVDAVALDSAPSWMTSDLKRIVKQRHRPDQDEIGNAYSMGRILDEDALICNLESSVTWTSKSNTFRVAEGDTLRTLMARSESSRVEAVLRSLQEVNDCLNLSKLNMAKAEEGSGGTYFLQTIKGSTPKASPSSPLHNETARSGSSPHNQHIMACFKPRNEEPGAKLNPRAAQRDAILPGEAAERECAAFLLDWGGFCNVPSTVLVEAPASFFQPGNTSDDPVVGSFQTFIQNAPDTAGDLSPHLFPPREVHKIGILDLRLLNMDRNDANILVTQCAGEYKLIPIDHALCFPDRVEVGWCDWVWWDWPQTLMPFDRQTIEWVAKIDIEADAKILERFFGMRAPCLRAFRCSSMWLKKAVAAGLNLHEIASVVVRSLSIDEPSTMEQIIARAKELAMMMNSDSRNKVDDGDVFDDRVVDRTTRRGSLVSLDGMIRDDYLTIKESHSVPPDHFFFSYVDRLLDDLVAEVGTKKQASASSFDTNSLTDSGWFSASSRKSPVELVKMGSPRLLSMPYSNNSLGPSSSGSSMISSNGGGMRKNLSFTSFPSLSL